MAAPSLKSSRTCSQCGNNGHNARTCPDNNLNANGSSSSSSTGIKLFGVVLTPVGNFSPSPDHALSSPLSPSSSSTNMRKCMSMNNLSQYEQQHHPLDSPGSHGDHLEASGYVSDDALHASGSRGRERKRGIPWTEDEHRLFLKGLKVVGKGDWRGISRNYVKTRTPTQVASHAQKYFLRHTNNNPRRRRRTSLFDMTTNDMTNASIEEEPLNLEDTTLSQSHSIIAQTGTSQNGNVTIPTLLPKPITTTTTSNQTRPIPLIPVPPSSKMAKLNLNESPTSSLTRQETELEPSLSLKLSSSPSNDEPVSRANKTFVGFNNSGGDSMISVA